VLTGVLTKDKRTCNYGCGTQKETNQGKKRATTEQLCAQSVAPSYVPPLQNRQEATRCVSWLWVLPWTPGHRGDGLVNLKGVCFKILTIFLRLRPFSYVCEVRKKGNSGVVFGLYCFRGLP
jgi:hypothetical protein